MSHVIATHASIAAGSQFPFYIWGSRMRIAALLLVAVLGCAPAAARTPSWEKVGVLADSDSDERFAEGHMLMCTSPDTLQAAVQVLYKAPMPEQGLRRLDARRCGNNLIVYFRNSMRTIGEFSADGKRFEIIEIKAIAVKSGRLVREGDYLYGFLSKPSK
ncbi:MAG: hypothetical protein JWO43_468 [Candidatus Adlerbacteria bacterium]|nr:hypothetical protein [Candidatus Adlerbacteria bacterium]